jgi:hypothetical protein
VAYEAHTNFQTSFSLALAASAQQQQQLLPSSTGQQEPWTPSSYYRFQSTMQQQGRASPGACPGRLQQGSCSSTGVALAPRFFTACGESTACRQQPEVCRLQAAVQDAVQPRSSAVQSSTGIINEQTASRNAAVQREPSATAGTEAAVGSLLQASQPGVDDPVAAALECMPDYQRAWALLQQVWWSLITAATVAIVRMLLLWAIASRVLPINT